MQPNDLILAKEYAFNGKLRLRLSTVLNVHDCYANGVYFATIAICTDGNEYETKNCTVIMRPFA